MHAISREIARNFGAWNLADFCLSLHLTDLSLWMSMVIPKSSHFGAQLITDQELKDIVDVAISEEREWYEYRNKQKTHVLFVFHIPDYVVDYQLYELFAEVGALSAKVMTHVKTGKSRGFGFVHFATRYQAQVAILVMDGLCIGRKRLRVDFKQKLKKCSVADPCQPCLRIAKKH